MLQGEGEAPLPTQPGDRLLQPSGWAHTMENTGDEDLVYYVIANNPVHGTVHYPDSGKWAAAGRYFRMVEADCYDGEE